MPTVTRNSAKQKTIQDLRHDWFTLQELIEYSDNWKFRAALDKLRKRIEEDLEYEESR